MTLRRVALPLPSPSPASRDVNEIVRCCTSQTCCCGREACCRQLPCESKCPPPPQPPHLLVAIACARDIQTCHTPLQALQQSIDQALEAQRLESEQQLALTAEFIAPKWPQLRAEITKVSSCQPGPGRACSVFPPITHRCSRGCASLTPCVIGVELTAVA
jgi:hypothetical protein